MPVKIIVDPKTGIRMKQGSKVTTPRGLQHIGQKVILNKIAEAEGKALPYPVIDDTPVKPLERGRPR